MSKLQMCAQKDYYKGKYTEEAFNDLILTGILIRKTCDNKETIDIASRVKIEHNKK